MDNITPLLKNGRELLFASAREGQGGKLKITKRKRLVLCSLVLFLIFFLGFCFGFYKGRVGDEGSGRALPQEKEPTLEETQETAQTVTPFSVQDNKINARANDFVFIQDGKLWFGKANASGAKPVVEKIADQTTSYVLSNSRSKIAYVSDDHLKVKTITSGEEITLQKLTPDKKPYSEREKAPEYLDAIGNIAWSSDDTKLAFVGANDAQADIYTIDIDGKNFKRLTNDEINEVSLVWSPDDRRIAFQTTTGFGSGAGYDSDIVVMNSDGGNYSKIVIEGKLPGDHHASPAENLRWINNNEISFLAWTVGGYQGIWKADVNTKRITSLVDEIAREDPAWSEKSNSFLYPLEEKNLLIVNLKNGNKLIETSGKVTQAVWSHDGDRIAYSIEDNPGKPFREGVYDLFIADADGSNSAKVISNGEFIIRDFSFSSDNKMILYIKGIFGSDPHDELWVINSDGSNDRKIDPDTDSCELYTTPHGNLAIYSESLSRWDQHIYYWLNLNTLLKEPILGGAFVFSLRFLAD